MDERFDTMQLPDEPDAAAPDGSDVRELLQLARGSMAHFELGAGRVSRAVAHRSVEEIWYILNGNGQMWPCPQAVTSRRIRGAVLNLVTTSR